jgi:hypothetical protein
MTKIKNPLPERQRVQRSERNSGKSEDYLLTLEPVLLSLTGVVTG